MVTNAAPLLRPPLILFAEGTKEGLEELTEKVKEDVAEVETKTLESVLSVR